MVKTLHFEFCKIFFLFEFGDFNFELDFFLGKKCGNPYSVTSNLATQVNLFLCSRTIKKM